MPADTSSQPALRSLMLGQQQVLYRLHRSKRRTIGFMIDGDGLRITAPKWVAIARIDAAIHDKQQWILTKLDAQRERVARALRHPFQWCDGARFPYLGDLLHLEVVGAAKADLLYDENNHRLTLFLPNPNGALQPDGVRPDMARPDVLQHDAVQIQHHVHRWLQRQARQLFAARLAHYAAQLGVNVSRLALSSARTRWGSCSTNCTIRLNWRLVHFSLPLIDYVVAHEVAHLREMNHGPLFWATVASIYPDHAAARKALRAHIPGSLPIFG